MGSSCKTCKEKILTMWNRNKRGNVCHYTQSNMIRLMDGPFSKSVDDLFYHLAFQNCSTNNCFCEECGNAVSSKDSLYDNIQPCPNFIYCQSFSQWKYNYKINNFNRFFNKLQLSTEFLTLYFLPLGPFPAFVHNFKSSSGFSLFELICEFLKVFFFGCKVHILPERNIEEFSFTKRKHSLTGKQQYLVEDIFPVLKSLLPKDGFCIVALSWDDLYPCEDLNFVLGQGNFNYHSCISSFGRFDPTYVRGFKGSKVGVSVEDLKDIECVDAALLWKLIKVTTHETCHVFGLSHCATFSCLMNESKSSEEALNQPLLLCPLCMKKIQHVCSHWPKRKHLFSVKAHFASILQFLTMVMIPMVTVFSKDAAESSDQFCVSRKLNSTVEWIQRTLSLLDSSPSATE